MCKTVRQFKVPLLFWGEEKTVIPIAHVPRAQVPFARWLNPLRPARPAKRFVFLARYSPG